ncbi:MAG: amino acid adenylation domain-containing protein, partial [Streptosporangiaceae bacterium]|nr:amino acid adenylation domain-containing protein [Streptosporangiaceae bacterium]
GLAVVVDDGADWDRIAGLDGADLTGTGVTPANVAYVIYTSGSTGQPKGVVIEHRNAVNYLCGVAERWSVGPADVVLQFGSFTFDASVLDTFTPLLAGARVVLAGPDTLHSPPLLAGLLRQARVTFALLPPTVLSLLDGEDFPDLRLLMAGGEELPPGVARAWIRPGLRLVNAYGPTEVTVAATYAELDATTPMPPPIGLPVQRNYRVYLLDPHGNPVPVGVTGELHVGGAGLARGYLNRPELTRERFIPDPFTPGQRLYRTGDLGRRRPDGSIMFAGRADGQVKIRGLRIELGEIEAALSGHPAVAQAVATVVTNPAGDKEIAAYLRPSQFAAAAGPGQSNAAAAGPGQVNAVGDEELRAWLARTLPAAWLPAYLTWLTEFPLTSSGKIDRGALPAPRTVTAPAVGRVPPRTATEAVLADLYATVLGRQAGATDSFFDLGGSSLTAMRLVALISQRVGVALGVASVFLHPTPRQLAATIDGVPRPEAQANSAPRTGSVSEGPLVKLTTGTDGPPLFLFHAVGGTVTAYAPLAWELAGAFSVYGLQSPGLDEHGEIPASLDALVSSYAERIRAAAPAGPYRLGGWSMGGVLALEVARRLERSGASVALLILLDAPFAIPADALLSEAELAGRFVADAAASLGLAVADVPDPATAAPEGQLGWLADRLGARDSMADSIAVDLHRRFAAFAAHTRMLAGYRASGARVRAPALVVTATGSPNAGFRADWPSLLSPSAQVLSVDSDHYGFLHPPLVADVGAIIREQGEGQVDGR